MAHDGQDGSHHAQDAEEIGVEQGLGFVWAGFFDGADQAIAGIVHQHVDPTRLTQNGRDASLD